MYAKLFKKFHKCKNRYFFLDKLHNSLRKKQFTPENGAYFVKYFFCITLIISLVCIIFAVNREYILHSL